MSFERLFESKTNRVVMIGLFLALLELVREKLVWSKQPKPLASIYLKALTEEPAEEAVQNAILAAAAEGEKSPETRQQKPADGGPITITELSPKSKPAASAEEYEKIEPAEGNKDNDTLRA
jgi:hypothetical protein